MWEYQKTDELYHHGILGMKWGVRRYQKKDGTRTAEGKKRANENPSSMSDDELQSKVRRLTMEKTYSKLSKENEKSSRMEKIKKVVDASSSLVNQAKNLNRETSTPKKTKLDLSNMTDQQLRDRINRTNLERQYNDMLAPPETVSRGKQFVSNILEVGGTTLAIGSSALAIALAIKELRG